MKLSRTKEYNFGCSSFPAARRRFSPSFLLLLPFEFHFAARNFRFDAVLAFTLGPQINQQIISITAGAAPAIYSGSKNHTRSARTGTGRSQREGRSIIIKRTA